MEPPFQPPTELPGLPMRQDTLDVERARPEGQVNGSKLGTRRNRFKVTIYRLLWVSVGVFFVVSKFALGFKYTTASSIMDLLCGLTGVGLYCVDNFHEDDPERWDWFFEADHREEIYLGVVILKIILEPPLGLSIAAALFICFVFCIGTVLSAIVTVLEDSFPYIPSAIPAVFAIVLTVVLLLSIAFAFLWVLSPGVEVQQDPKKWPEHILTTLVLASPGIVIIICCRNALHKVAGEIFGTFVFWAVMMMLVACAVVIRILFLAWDGRRALDTLLAQAKAKIVVEPPPLLVESLPPHQIRTAINALGSSSGSLTEYCLRAWAVSHQPPEPRRSSNGCVAPTSFFHQLRKADLEEETEWDKDFDWNLLRIRSVPASAKRLTRYWPRSQFHSNCTILQKGDCIRCLCGSESQIDYCECAPNCLQKGAD